MIWCESRSLRVKPGKAEIVAFRRKYKSDQIQSHVINIFMQCRSAIAVRWGLKPLKTLWLYDLILKLKLAYTAQVGNLIENRSILDLLPRRALLNVSQDKKASNLQSGNRFFKRKYRIGRTGNEIEKQNSLIPKHI